MATQKKKRGPGRPRQTRADAAADERVLKEEGKRLAQALEALQIAKIEAAVRCGITPQKLNDILQGVVPLSRRYLLAFASIGIPADFLLGSTSTFVPLGQTRTRAELVDDLGVELARRLAERDVTPVPLWYWGVNGQEVLDAIMPDLVADAEKDQSRVRMMLEMRNEVLGIAVAVRELMQTHDITTDAKDAVTQLMRGVVRRANLMDALGEQRSRVYLRPLYPDIDSTELAIQAIEAARAYQPGDQLIVDDPPNEEER